MEDAAEILAGRAGTRISVGESELVMRD
jgi:hypothetical protein